MRLITIFSIRDALSIVVFCLSPILVFANEAPTNSFLRNIEIINKDATLLLNENSKIVELANGFRFTEGPLWIEKNQTLLFSDIPNNVIYQYQEKTGVSLYLEHSGYTNKVEGDYPLGSNGLLLNSAQQLVLFQQGDRRVAIMDSDLINPKAKYSTLVGDYLGQRFNSPNDGIFDSKGNLYFTDPPYGLKNKINDVRKQLDFQGIYKVTPQGSLTLLDKTVEFPNGISLSPDEKTLYVGVSDPLNPIWLAYDVDTNGNLNNKKVLLNATQYKKVDEHGVPDGMSVHSSGVIFATAPGGVWLITPQGKVIAKIHTGQKAANCTLTKDEKTLFITAQNTLLKVELNSKSK